MRIAALTITGTAAGLYALAEAKVGGLLLHGWLLLPPRAYLAGALAIAALLPAAYMLGRSRR